MWYKLSLSVWGRLSPKTLSINMNFNNISVWVLYDMYVFLYVNDMPSTSVTQKKSSFMI